MTKQPSPTRRYTKKLAVAAGSLSAMAYGAQEADADLVYFHPGYAITISTNSPGTANWDVDFAGGADFQLAASAFGNISLRSFGFNGFGLVRLPADNFLNNAAARNLAPGFEQLPIGPGLSTPYLFGTSGSRIIVSADAVNTNSAIGFSAGGDNYIGFQFNSSSPLYGWARIEIDLGNAGVGDETLTIAEWAYEDSGGDILVGAVPEPSSFALMAAGAAGVLAWKRRRRKGNDADTDSAA